MPDSAAGPDLLIEPVIQVGSVDRTRERLSLPALLARLLTGPEIVGFPALIAEQQGHWWRFLVRCAAKVLYESGRTVAEASVLAPSTLATEMEVTLRGLAPEGAWLLYQSNPKIPGFLQIPTPDAAPPGKGNNYSQRSISLLTSTIGGKNHERKTDVARALDAEQAVYALVEYQGSALYGGRGNYETQLVGSRSGAGSGVPFMGARIGASNMESFRHDVGVLLDRRPDTVNVLGVAGKIWALWAEPWDGKGQIGSERLDPAFIQVARMVRLGEPSDGLYSTLWFRPTDTGRVRDHSEGGVLGDPFTPLVPDPKSGNPKVRGTLRDGYTYREVVRLLFGDAQLGGQPSASVSAIAEGDAPGRGDATVVFAGTAYEQGKTGGFHQREILLPQVTARRIRRPDPVRATHTQMLSNVAEAKKALRGAARILLSGALKPRDGDEGKISPPVVQLEQRVDARYLDHLFEAVERCEAGDEQWLQPWLDWLAAEAEVAFEAGKEQVPSSIGRRFQREVEAQNYLGFKLWQLRGSPISEQHDARTTLDSLEAIDSALVEEEIS